MALLKSIGSHLYMYQFYSFDLQTLEISGKIRPLLGQNLKSKEPPLALFALCCPFGPLPLADMPPRDYTFKSKHKMDMSPMNMDPRYVTNKFNKLEMNSTS